MVLTTKKENLTNLIIQLRLDVNAGKNHLNNTTAIEEFKLLEKSYHEQINEKSKQLKEANENAQPQDLFDEDITLEMSQNFFDIWIKKAFNNLFIQKEIQINKQEAKKINDFYKNTFGSDNEKYLENYNNYKN